MTARAWRGHAALEALAPVWDELARESGIDALCNSHYWTAAYARAYVPEGELFGWTFEESGAPQGVVALRREPSRGALALRRAIFAADGTFDSDYLAPPVRPGREREVVRRTIELARAEPGLHALVLGGLPDDSPFLAALRDELDGRGTPRREHAQAALAIRLPDSFDGYLAGLKPRMRSKVRSALRAAEERGARLAWCEQADQIPVWLAELYDLHQQRWQSADQPGSFADPRRRAFYEQLARAAHARGELCFARLEQAGATAAIQFGVRVGGRYYQIQEGFDPALDKQRVGTALRALAIADLIGGGLRHYDFMAGDAQHKRDWGGEPRPCTTVALPLPRWRATWAYRLRALLDRRARRPS